MKIAIPKERHPDETRVAGSPEVVEFAILSHPGSG